MRKIVFISPVRFDALKQRHQGLAIELAKNNYQVFFVNPILSNGFSLKIKNKVSHETIKNLKIIDISIPFKAVSHPFIQYFSTNIAIKLLKKKLHLSFSECYLWIAEPSLAASTNYKWGKIVYDCCDLHGLFPKQKAKVWNYYEKIITEKADLIIASHPFIKEHFPMIIQRKCLLVPNATFFDTVKANNKISNNEKIKLLSSGAHYEWIDIDWLKMLASKERVELHIAGKGRGKEFKQLISMKNVVFHGELDSIQLLRLMGECHIGLVPFKDIDLTKGVDPIKVYDYAAIGLKIWAPDIKALRSNFFITDFVKDLTTIKIAINHLKFNSETKNIKFIPTWKERIKKILPYL